MEALETVQIQAPGRCDLLDQGCQIIPEHQLKR